MNNGTLHTSQGAATRTVKRESVLEPVTIRETGAPVTFLDEAGKTVGLYVCLSADEALTSKDSKTI
jgi:hypothetical protein